MSIARVLNGSGLRAEPTPEIEKVIETTKAQNGCERVYALINDQGHGMAILVFRDKEALAHAEEQLAVNREMMEAAGVVVSSVETYQFIER
jgi:hypothetical protein